MSEKIKNLRMNTNAAMEYFKTNLAFTLGPVELKEMMLENNIKIIDVRAKEDYNISHIPNAENIEYDELKNKITNDNEYFSKTEINVVYCYNYLCHLADKAAYVIAKAGFPVMVMQGGFKSWTEDFHFAVVTDN